jgi:chemotaxis protein methyltransferase CheR
MPASPPDAMSPDSEVEALEVRMLLEALYARYGYDFRGYGATSMRRRVVSILAKSGLNHLGDLQHKLLTEPEYFADVLEQLTVQVSDLFRDPGFFEVLRTRVMPILRTYPLLRIWHSGCANGEEVYSNAIVLSEEGLYERAQLYATDLSAHALDQAKQGLYSSTQLATFIGNYEKAGGIQNLNDYYTAAYEGFVVKEMLRRNVLFFQHNLVSDHAFGEMQVIFCRNVLIYFGEELRDRVLDKFAQSLCRGGFLCLGSSEKLSRAHQAKGFVEFAPDERIYRYEN